MDKVVFFNIPAEDIERAKKFYTEIFGWNIGETEIPGYQLVKTTETDDNNLPKERGAINGGLYERFNSDERTEITIEVSSIDDYLKKIEDLGGSTVTGKIPINGIGFYAEFFDTENNIIGLFQDIKSA
jgi:predicted enzyme related to lactoylglutathione lyase